MTVWVYWKTFNERKCIDPKGTSPFSLPGNYWWCPRFYYIIMSSRAKVTRSFPCFLREYLSGKVVLASGVERCSSGEIKRYIRFISRCVCVLHNMLSPCKIWLTSRPSRPSPCSLYSCIFPCVDKDILVWQIKQLKPVFPTMTSWVIPRLICFEVGHDSFSETSMEIYYYIRLYQFL